MMIEIISGIFLVMGCIVCFASIIGMMRLPDYYSRCHASGNSETLGLLLPCIGLVIYSGVSLMSLKLLILCALIFLNNPIGTHTLGRAAFLSGYPMWKKGK